MPLCHRILLPVLVCACLHGALAADATADEQLADSLRGRHASCVDFRSGDSFTIGVQRLLANGTIPAEWQPDGARLCLGTAQEVASAIVADGSNGAVVVWVDMRSGDADLYAQRLTTTGSVAPGWHGDGLVLCTSRGSQYQVALCNDGAGGAITAWQDYRGGETADIFAQRILGAGTAAWVTDGVAVCADSGDQAAPAIAADGAGGAHVLWQDRRSGDADLRYAHLSAAGELDVAARTLVGGPGDQTNASVCPDGTGGLYLMWRDTRTSGVELRVLRLDPSGGVVTGWPAEGMSLVANGATPHTPVTSPDGAGGLLAAWCERRGGPGDIRAQRVTATGQRAWSDSGRVVCAESHEQYAPALIADGAAGAILAWEDHRTGPADIYAQRVLADGSLAWAVDGVPIVAAPGSQFDVGLVPDGEGGAVATWSDGSVSARAAFVRNRPVVMDGMPRFQAAEQGPGRARLTWLTTNSDARRFDLERRTDVEEWKKIAEVRAEARGEIVHEDRTVPSGVMASYRLALPTAQGLVYLEEIAVAIPAPMPLALRFARGVNGGREVRLAFVLESHDRARVEIIDVAGRRVLSQDLGSPGAGEHEVTIGARGLPSGQYFVRLHQGRATRNARLTLIR